MSTTTLTASDLAFLDEIEAAGREHDARRERAPGTFVLVYGEAYITDTSEEIEAAKVALREAGLGFADVWAGDPYSGDDSYKNGQILFV